MKSVPLLTHVAASVVLAFAALAFLISSCGDLATDRPVLSPTPWPVSTLAPAAPIPLDEIIVVSLHDVTSSAIRYQDDAKLLVAEQLHLLLRAGHGGFQLVVGTISHSSFDPANTRLALRVDGLSPKPVMRQTSPRPQAPDLTACQANPFGRQQCAARLVAEYNTRLQAAVADEAEAAREFASAKSSWDAVFANRSSQVEVAAGQVRDLPLNVDFVGTDIRGALLRAAETLAASKAPRKLLLVSSDWLPSGPQQEGELHLPQGTTVKAIYLDCLESRDCLARKQAWTEKLLAAGAERVLWFDPGSSRLTTNLFEEVLQ